MLDYNAQGLPDPYQLKGILLGNPWTDPTLDNAGAPPPPPHPSTPPK